jgi:hypothetical protein
MRISLFYFYHANIVIYWVFNFSPPARASFCHVTATLLLYLTLTLPLSSLAMLLLPLQCIRRCRKCRSKAKPPSSMACGCPAIEFSSRFQFVNVMIVLKRQLSAPLSFFFLVVGLSVLLVPFGRARRARGQCLLLYPLTRKKMIPLKLFCFIFISLLLPATTW